MVRGSGSPTSIFSTYKLQAHTTYEAVSSYQAGQLGPTGWCWSTVVVACACDKERGLAKNRENGVTSCLEQMCLWLLLS